MTRRLARAVRAGLTGVFVALAAAGMASAQTVSKAVVEVDEVRTEPLSQTVPIIGRLVARQSGIVAARIGGPVGKMHVSVGDRVKEGDVLATLVTARLKRQRDLLKAEAAETAAQIELAEALVVLRRQELRRLEGLRESAAFSKGRYEDTEQRVVVAEVSVGAAMARHERAKANLALADIDLHNAAIRAPYAGVITVIHTEIGSFVTVGGPVVSMVSDGKLEIEADVPAIRIPALEPGMVVAIRLDDKSRHDAVVRAVVPEENPLTRTRQVRFTPDIAMAGKVLAVNQSVVVLLPLGPYREVVSVHKDAVITRQGQTLVYVVEDDVAQIRPVRLGNAVGTRFEVVGGLVPGERVVVRGNERLQPGQPVAIEGPS